MFLSNGESHARTERQRVRTTSLWRVRNLYTFLLAPEEGAGDQRKTRADYATPGPLGRRRSLCARLADTGGVWRTAKDRGELSPRGARRPHAATNRPGQRGLATPCKARPSKLRKP